MINYTVIQNFCRIQVLSGLDMIALGRRAIGVTNPVDAEPGSVRGDFAVSIYRSIFFHLNLFILNPLY